MKYSLILLFASQLGFAQEAVTYKIDPTHASIVFKVNHLGFANVYGVFGAVDGKMVVNDAKPEASSFEVTVKADSLDTKNAKRDEHLKGADFFNVKQFPTITLKSKSVKKVGEGKFEVKADLNLRGVTKPVSFVWNHFKTGEDPWKNTRTGGETEFKIKRTDHKMTYMSKPGEIGDEVTMIVSLEGVKQ